jgi:hypothetical protein
MKYPPLPTFNYRWDTLVIAGDHHFHVVVHLNYARNEAPAAAFDAAGLTC